MAAVLDLRGPRTKAAATIAAELAFDRVSHDYHGVPSVVDVSFTVEPGEVLCLLGQSGCGKTTLLRIAAGIERQTAGRVLVNGREIAGPSAFTPPERRGIGLMFQDYALFPHLTVLRNVMFGLTALPRAEAEREARAALARVGLEAYAGDYPHALSGGEQQRVALARAIAPRPGVLLMDEPFSGLDRRLRDVVRDETMAVLRESRATSIIVTHDPEDALRMGDRIALMRAGRLIQVGPGDELYLAPKDLLVARFFSELNEVDAVVSGGRVETPVGTFAAPGFVEGTAVVVAIRPQGVFLSIDGEGVEGRVVQRRFLGEVDLVETAVAGLDSPLKARLRGPSPLHPGSDVRVTIAPADILIFAKPPESPI